ncbi:hypothetical protein RZS08_06575, partial [Arthrospira platensis SPKY1]|nr:hypothetical protein [Arthrospira platensis SPKY1]
MPQIEQHARDVDVDRANFPAHAAQRAGVGQGRGLFQPGEQRGDDGANRAGIDPAVGVAAGYLVDRA